MRKLLFATMIIIIFLSVSGFVKANPDDEDYTNDIEVYLSAQGNGIESVENVDYILVPKKANTYLDKIIASTNLEEETEQILVTITSPLKQLKEKTLYGKYSYPICGTIRNKNIKVSVSVYNSETIKFEEVIFSPDYRGVEMHQANEDLRIFAHDIDLLKGENRIKIVAYDSTIKEDDLVLGESLQVNYFTLTVMDESLVRRIHRQMSPLERVTDIFRSLENLVKGTRK